MSTLSFSIIVQWPPQSDCHSPARHSAFSNQHELVDFIVSLRELGNGIPVGVKMCVGHPGDIARLCRAISEIQNGPDFLTIDGAEGGTGAAPPEFMNSVGLPLEEGLILVRNMIEGAGLRSKTKLIASGRVLSGFDLLRTICLGADAVNSARGFMMSLGCIQALKCNTNKCPTGITTQDELLMAGLDPEDKMVRVFNFHKKTVEAACDLLGAMGKRWKGVWLSLKYILIFQSFTMDLFFSFLFFPCRLQ
jgi:glutamate synthase domain-containing protein 2